MTIEKWLEAIKCTSFLLKSLKSKEVNLCLLFLQRSTLEGIRKTLSLFFAYGMSKANLHVDSWSRDRLGQLLVYTKHAAQLQGSKVDLKVDLEAPRVDSKSQECWLIVILSGGYPKVNS